MAFQSSFNIGDLTTSRTSIGFRIENETSTNVNYGQQVVNLGDINGDGVTDFAIGMPNYNNGTGGFYIFTAGQDRLDDIGNGWNVNSRTNDAFFLTGPSGGRFERITNVGDQNADGIDDFVVGLNNSDGGAGSAYLIFGNSNLTKSSLRNTLTVENLDDDPADGIEFVKLTSPESGSRFSVDVDNLGDINGDGIIDFALSASGRDFGGQLDAGQVTVLYGGQDWTASIDTNNPTSAQGFTVGITDRGMALSQVDSGDFNGDGHIDLLISGPSNSGGQNGVGRAFVVFGDSTGFDDIDLNTVSSADGIEYTGPTDSGNLYGLRMENIGDIDQDGHDDIALSARRTDNGTGRTDSGSVFIVYGSDNIGTELESIDISTLGTNASSVGGFRFNGSGSGQEAGTSVAGLGDINGDGYDDFAIGSTGGNGLVTVIYGGDRKGNTVDSSDFDNSTDGFNITGRSANSQFGENINALGDIDGDGLADYALGARQSDENVNNGGETNILFGQLSTGDQNYSGTNIAQTIRGGDGANRIDAGGGDDILYGNDGNDSLFGEAGNDTMFGGGGSDLIDGGAGVDTVSYAETAAQRAIKVLRADAETDTTNLDSTNVADIRSGITAFLNGRQTTSRDGTDTLTNVENIIGSNYDDYIHGNDVANELSGGAGNDVLIGDNIIGITGIEGQVFRAYQAVFDRDPDAAGFNAFVQEIRIGNSSQEDVITEFVGSTEFQDTYGALGNQAFIEQLYRNLFNREGDDAGVIAFTNELNSGRSRASVVIELANSSEFLNLMEFPGAAFQNTVMDYGVAEGQIYRLYQAIFDRNPDFPGYTNFVNELQAGIKTIETYVDEFITSTEFTSLYGSLNNEDFVEQLYQNVLPGNQDQAGRAAFTAELDSGNLTRAQIVLEFSESNEFQANTDASATAFIDSWQNQDGSADTLIGGTGDDIMMGGRGADTFVADGLSGHDEIVDYNDEIDVIDIMNLTDFDTFAEIQGALTQDGADALLTFDADNSLLIRNTDISDLDAGDFGFNQVMVLRTEQTLSEAEVIELYTHSVISSEDAVNSFDYADFMIA